MFHSSQTPLPETRVGKQNTSSALSAPCLLSFPRQKIPCVFNLEMQSSPFLTLDKMHSLDQGQTYCPPFSSWYGLSNNSHQFSLCARVLQGQWCLRKEGNVLSALDDRALAARVSHARGEVFELLGPSTRAETTLPSMTFCPQKQGKGCS